MKPDHKLAAMSLALTALFTSPVLAADAAKPAAGGQPNADQILRKMSAKLAAARSFSVQATREIDPGLIEGHAAPEKANITLAVQRPNRVAARAVGKAGARRFVADGNTLTVLDEKTNHYATVPMRTTIDGLIDALDLKYGFVPPLGDFAVSNPYQEIRQQAQTVAYLGRGKAKEGFLGLGGVECHHLALKGVEADAELWIAVSDQLPRKLVATFHRAGRPQVRINFSKWDLAAPVKASDFAFTPPAGAEKIEMWTVARMQNAAKN